MPDRDDEELLRRATDAWFRSGGTDQPTAKSDVIEIDGRPYVRLANARGVLAVYRLGEDGQLRRLRRWPGIGSPMHPTSALALDEAIDDVD